MLNCNSSTEQFENIYHNISAKVSNSATTFMSPKGRFELTNTLQREDVTNGEFPHQVIYINLRHLKVVF